MALLIALKFVTCLKKGVEEIIRAFEPFVFLVESSLNKEFKYRLTKLPAIL
jgi:hypothetical protein